MFLLKNDIISDNNKFLILVDISILVSFDSGIISLITAGGLFMSVILKEHNKEAYEKINKEFEKNNRIAVVEPPGTGKSFIITMEDFQKKQKRKME